MYHRLSFGVGLALAALACSASIAAPSPMSALACIETLSTGGSAQPLHRSRRFKRNARLQAGKKTLPRGRR